MRFDTSQQMRMGQQMKLAPRMIQSMEILQMPMMALQERVDQELESNVALEIVEPTGDSEAPPAEDKRLDDKELVVADSPSAEDDWQRLSEFEQSYSEALDNEYSSRRRPRVEDRDRKMDAMANVADRGKSLTEELMDQWRFAEVPPEMFPIGELLISYIDDDGLLGADLDTILEQNASVPGLELTPENLAETLAEIQTRLDPPGIGAVSRRECILLQIDRKLAEPDADPGYGIVRRLVEEHFDDLIQNRLPRISEKSGLSMTEIQTAMRLMRNLSISPGRDLVDVEVPPIIPDVLVELDEETDEYVATLSNGVLPQLRVSRTYEDMSRDRGVDKDARDFVSDNVRRAQWLIDSIQQRSNTLLRVVGVALARQREFVEHGPQALKPLPMIDVADQLGIHVGTVSRAVADKWLQTPRGLIPLRRFFTGGTATDSGEDMSWDAIKAKLKDIIDAEDKASPLSDQALADAMKEQGIDIARRTVVKYRQQLDIPPARRRKVF